MLSNDPAAVPDCAPLLLAPIPSSEYDVERAAWTPLQGSRNRHALETEEVGVPYISRCDDPVLIDNRLSVLQITIFSLNNHLTPTQTATASTSHISDSEPYRTIPYSLILTLPQSHEPTLPVQRCCERVRWAPGSRRRNGWFPNKR